MRKRKYMPLLGASMATIIVLCLVVSVNMRLPGALPDAVAAPLDKEIKRAEKIIDSLRAIERAGGSFETFRLAFGRFYPDIFEDVAALREGDLKTDLGTAVFLYEAAFRVWRAGDATIRNCDGEMRELYHKLCLENLKGTRAQLLRAKARLHTRWAESTLNQVLGCADSATLSATAEVRAARNFDLALAARAVAELKSLERDVYPYSSVAAFEEGHAAVAVSSLKEFSARASEAFLTIDRALASLPRSPLRQTLQNARNSYRDGLFWWQKTEPRNALTISADALLEQDPLEAAHLDAKAARYTVVLNWRNAQKQTARAEQLIRSSAKDLLAFR